MKYIIATGNVFEGLEFHGPFDTSDEAGDYAASLNIMGDDWWIGEVQSPAVVSL